MFKVAEKSEIGGLEEYSSMPPIYDVQNNDGAV